MEGCLGSSRIKDIFFYEILDDLVRKIKIISAGVIKIFKYNHFYALSSFP